MGVWIEVRNPVRKIQKVNLGFSDQNQKVRGKKNSKRAVFWEINLACLSVWEILDYINGDRRSTQKLGTILWTDVPT